MLHLDMMDGHFVPNLTIGPPVVESIRKITRSQLDVHLMITDPDRYAPIFIEAGATRFRCTTKPAPIWTARLRDDPERGCAGGRGDQSGDPGLRCSKKYWKWRITC